MTSVPADPPRWQQRLNEFGRAIDLFARTDAIRRERPLTEAEEAGLVQFFELSVELGWKTAALWLRATGAEPRERSTLNILREAARVGLLDDGDRWAAAVERRNVLSHTYDPDAFSALVADAGPVFLPMLRALHARLRELAT